VEAVAERRGGASTATLVIFIIIAVAGLGLAFAFYSKWDALTATIGEQKQQLEALGDQVSSLQNELAQWRETSGWDTQVAMAEALTPIPDLVPAKTKRALELLSERAHQAEQLAQTMDAQYQKAAGEAASLEQQLEQTKAAKDAEIQALGDEKANMEAGYKQQLKTRDDLVTQLRTEKRAAEDAAQEAKDQLAAATADFSRDKLAMEATVTQLREKVRIIEAKAEEPDGFIVAFDNKTGYGSVNLGRIDHVQTGMIFQVYRLGRGGQIIPKGRVQVRRVQEKASLVGVIEAVPGEPVIEGDYVMTALLAKEKPVFVTAGWFPPELGYTPDELSYLIERWGGVVAEEVTLDTNYLVVGKTRVEGEVSPEAQEAAQKGLEAYNLARELGARILDVDDFLKLLRR